MSLNVFMRRTRKKEQVPQTGKRHRIFGLKFSKRRSKPVHLTCCTRTPQTKNQIKQPLGTIKSSNLCTEIIEYTAPDEVAVCNLASIALPKFVTEDGKFDHQKLYDITKVITRNLNKVIDVNYYPVEEARNSNMRHRPIGIGVQGLADAFILLRMPFDSEEARGLNKDIHETIYFAAMEASMELAKLMVLMNRLKAHRYPKEYFS